MIQTRLLLNRTGSSGDSSVRERVIRERRAETIEDQRVGGLVGDGDGRRVGLGVEPKLGVAVVAEDDPPRIAGGLAGDFVLPIEVAHPR